MLSIRLSGSFRLDLLIVSPLLSLIRTLGISSLRLSLTRNLLFLIILSPEHGRYLNATIIPGIRR
jgi:hypothetical protein